jgi:UDP-4-amino-4-deoxy-L-arabinose-oxoglutarate aminotransferase
LIENCAQAFGARHKNRVAGTLGQVSITSFHATKLLTTGEGGMALSSDNNMLRKMRELKQGKLASLTVRYLYLMTDLQAALGLSQFARYNEFLHRRKEIADYYFSELSGLPLLLPHGIRDKSIFFRFPLRSKRNFEELKASFERRGVHVRKGVDTLLHRKCGMEARNFPTTEQLFSETVCIPIYPALQNNHCERIISSCREVFRNS